MSERYDYREAIKADIIDYLQEEEVNLKDFARNERLREDAESSITGSASGSYFCNAWKAQEALCHNYDLLAEACKERGGDAIECMRNPELGDSIIRQDMFESVMQEVIELAEQKPLSEIRVRNVEVPETERYNHEEAVKNDIVGCIEEAYIEGNGNHNLQEYAGRRDTLIEELRNDSLVDKYTTVTGNPVGSYFCNAREAEEALCHNLDLLADACEACGGDAIKYLENPELGDSAIRCHVLYESTVVEKAVEQIEQELGIDLNDEHAFEKNEHDND